jgi:predicted nucleotidyltransferase
MRERIDNELAAIEEVEGVRIVYAVESGSRAWGFPSQDSDYDVRFLYVRPVDAYLSIVPVRDVIERPISDALDLNGWDLQKALGLLRKSNLSILEWLHSSIVYLDRFDVANGLRNLEPVYVTVRSSLYHYLSLAKGQWQQYLQGEEIAAKKYFYVLRPVLACGWLLAYGTFPPLDLETLVHDRLSDNGELVAIIARLLERKRAGDELTFEPRNPMLHTFLEQQLVAISAQVEAMPKETEAPDHAALDEIFRTTLRLAWS